MCYIATSPRRASPTSAVTVGRISSNLFGGYGPWSFAGWGSSRRGFPWVMTTAHKFSALSPGRHQDLRLQICFSRSVSRELFDDLNKRSRRLLEQFKRLCTPIRLPPPLQSCRFHHERDELTLPLAADTRNPWHSLSAQCNISTMSLRHLAVSINLDRRKIELLPIVSGPGSRTFRRKWLCTEGAAFPVTLTGGPAAEVAMTDDR